MPVDCEFSSISLALKAKEADDALSLLNKYEIFKQKYFTLVPGAAWRNKEWGVEKYIACLLYTSPSPRDVEESRMPSSA